MMKSIYFDVFAGISGDMCLGALLDLGCPGDELRSKLLEMRIPGFDLTWERVMRGPLSGIKAHVHVEEEPQSHRKLADVLEIVDRTQWPKAVRTRVEEVFTALAQAEGHIHNKPFDQIHFHEVGCYDAIVDISGTIYGLHLLGIEQCACSRIHVGEGFVTTRHGKLPLPVPATAHLLKGFDIYSTGCNREMVTPTGAALLHILAGETCSLPEMNLVRTGYGAGTRDPDDLPGMLRVFLGETSNLQDSVTVVESNIDDMHPEWYEPLREKLFERGALDVTFQPLQMKKGRPGIQLSVIVSPALRETIAQVIFQHSTAIGVRMHDCQRRVLEREAGEVETEWGPIRGKVCWGKGIEKRFTPEYDDCYRIHKEHHIPLSVIYQKALQAYTSLK